jgi:hypothetical protein
VSGETEKDISGWTTDTLRVHLERQLDDMRHLLDERYATQVKALDAAFAAADKAVQAALLSAEKAVTKAEIASEKRFESVNEFRAALSDQTASFLSRTEYDAAHDAVVERITTLTDRVNRSEGSREGVRLSGGVLVSVVTVAVSVMVAGIALVSFLAR